MKPLGPYIDEDGTICYHVHHAAQMLGICRVTLWRWAEQGQTPSGFDLDTRRLPVLVHGGARGKRTPKTRRDFRIAIPEARIVGLKALLQQHPVRRGHLSDYDRLALRNLAAGSLDKR
jgi:hypothetical protein